MAEARGNGSAGDVVPSNLIETAAQVQAIRDIIDDIEVLGSRSIVGAIENLTAKTLILTNDHHERWVFRSSTFNFRATS